MKMKTNNIRRFATFFLLSLMVLPVCGTVVEQMPSFPGGDRALMDFIEHNFRCPEEIKKARLHGKVMLSFIIDKDGSVKDVRSVSSFLKNIQGERVRNWDLTKLCIEEAVRVFRLMPKWIPGRRFGDAFAVKYYCSLTFNDPSEELCEFLDSEEICCKCTKEIQNLKN